MFSDGDKAPRIDEMSLLFAEDPAAQSVIAEIWPVETENFEPQTFTYVVRPVLEDGDRGFDRLEIFTQVPASAVHSVAIDGREIIDSFPPKLEEDRIVISFEPFTRAARQRAPHRGRLRRQGAALWRGIYRLGLRQHRARAQAASPTRQRDPSALPATPYQCARPSAAKLVRKVTAHPTTLTPNGDGINDQTMISYDLRNIGAPRQIALRIFDLSGRLVREVISTPAVSGSFAAAWDGRRTGGDLVAPGVYFYQVDLNHRQGHLSSRGYRSCGLLSE